jgi:hypothetical protein
LAPRASLGCALVTEADRLLLRHASSTPRLRLWGARCGKYYDDGYAVYGGAEHQSAHAECETGQCFVRTWRSGGVVSRSELSCLRVPGASNQALGTRCFAPCILCTGCVRMRDVFPAAAWRHSSVRVHEPNFKVLRTWRNTIGRVISTHAAMHSNLSCILQSTASTTFHYTSNFPSSTPSGRTSYRPSPSPSPHRGPPQIADHFLVAASRLFPPFPQSP